MIGPTAVPMTDRDDALTPTLHRFQDAVSALVDPQRDIVNGRRRYTASWYQQLVDAVAGRSGQRSGGMSLLPLWPAPFDHLQRIDKTVHSWHAEAADSHERHNQGAIYCLNVFSEASWRPQDAKQLDSWGKQLENWVKTAKIILDPPFQAFLPDPCPICGADTVLVEDSGERVRRSALSLGYEGCLCAGCGAFWEAVNLSLLGRMLGYPNPDGVVEHEITTCGS